MNLHQEAKRWLKALRAGDAAARARLRRAYPRAPDRPCLRDVQHALARERGAESWRALKSSSVDRAAAAALETGGQTHAERVATFLQFACWDHHVHGKEDHYMYDRAAQRILGHHPEIARDSLYTAVVCGDLAEVERMLEERPEAARERGGARAWTPILYLCYTRFTYQPTIDRATAIARLLLDRGADPNDFYMAGDARYSALTGVAGDGEQDAPRQPYARELFDLLLERGAEPFDIQVLYDTHFHGDLLWWLELVYEHTIHTDRAAAWADPEWSMFDMGGYGSGARFILDVAIEKHDVRLVEWAVARGANPNAAAARDHRFPKRSLYEEAVRHGDADIAELLARHGATRVTVTLEGEERFIDACLRLDRHEARRLLDEHPEYRRSATAMIAAAKRDRPDAIDFLLDLGFPLEIENEHKQRALHHAAANSALAAAKRLVERGAEIDPVEQAYGATPIGWAAHVGHPELLAFLGQHTRNVWRLAFGGHVDRLRQILDEDPSKATSRDDEGNTPLWWLPEDEEKALQIVDLLLEHGADPSAVNQHGRTAADWALKRGMRDVAARLAAPNAPRRPHAMSAVERYERLANDLSLAFDSGDAAALQRIGDHYKRVVTRDDLHAGVWQRVRTVREERARPGSFPVSNARELIAREAGFANWDEFARSLDAGEPAPGEPYVIDGKTNTLAPRRALTLADWDRIVSVMMERGISGLHAGGQLTDEALSRVARVESLTRLNFDGSRLVTDEGLRHLARMPQLRELDVGQYPGGLFTDRGLEVLRQLPDLRHFEMCWQNPITDAGVQHLSACERLEHVNLLGSRTGDGVIRALAGKPRLAKFKSGQFVTDAGLARFREFPMFASWHGGELEYSLMSAAGGPTHLLLDGPFTDRGLANLAGLDGLAALSFFSHVSQLTPDGLEALGGLSRLAMLGCQGTLCNDVAMRHIASLPQLRMLMAQGTVASDDGFAALSRSRTLEHIWGRECPNLTGRGFVALSRLPSLRGLAVSCKRVDDEALSTLPSFPALTALMPMDVQDDGFRHVGRCERLESLWCMYCRDTTDVATSHLMGLTRLKTYYAGATQITDHSLELLGAIASLERIELYECREITDAGLPFLAKLPRLREISFDGNPKVTLAGTAAFPARVRVNYSV